MIRVEIRNGDAFVSSTDATRNFKTLYEDVLAEHDKVFVESHGKVVCVITSAENVDSNVQVKTYGEPNGE